MSSPSPPGTTTPDEVDAPRSREELLKLLDRETAVARATQGRLAVLIVELRRVDRLQALLRGPAPHTTMTLVLERLRKALRPEDRIAPLSDEQVCVLLPRLSHPSQAVLAAVKLLRSLDRPIAHEGGTAVLRPCIGVSTCPEHGYDPGHLLMAADVSRSIAQTREEGYHVFQAEDAVETELYRGLDLDLERAIRANELELHYQPQVDLATGRAVAVEAQLRWRHLNAGEVATATIIGIAERTGLMATLAFWLLNAALRQASEWDSEAIRPRMAVDLPVSMLSDRELPAVVDQCLKTWNVPASRLLLEIPENAAIAEAERSTAILTRLKGVGVQLGLDGFGSGYSSLAQLARMPLDEIKVDAPFVAALPREGAESAVVRAAIDIGRHFGLRVSAGGADTAPCLERLRAMGCAVAQGEALGAVGTAEAVRAWWRGQAGA